MLDWFQPTCPMCFNIEQQQVCLRLIHAAQSNTDCTHDLCSLQRKLSSRGFLTFCLWCAPERLDPTFPIMLCVGVCVCVTVRQAGWTICAQLEHSISVREGSPVSSWLGSLQISHTADRGRPGWDRTEGELQTETNNVCRSGKECGTYRETLSQHTGLLELPRPSKLLHVSAEVAFSTLGSHAGLTALTPAEKKTDDRDWSKTTFITAQLIHTTTIYNLWNKFQETPWH